MKKLITLALTVLISLSLFAQRESNKDFYKKMKSDKVAYLTTAMDLTPEEAQKFWPIYNEFQKERMDSHKQFTESIKNSNLNESEAKKTLDTYVNFHKKEVELIDQYTDKFLSVLPAQKVVKLYKAEKSFRRDLMKQYKRGDNKYRSNRKRNKR